MAQLLQFRAHDCWRTWFFDECEEAGLFGINEKHLGLVRLSGTGVHPYRPGTVVYLDDAPVFRAAGGRFHRICGPYEVLVTPTLPEGALVIHAIDGLPIVYQEAHPERGPWGNRTKRRSGVCGVDLKYRQTAKQFNYYPYRFAIRRSRRWAEIVVSHSAECELHDD